MVLQNTEFFHYQSLTINNIFNFQSKTVLEADHQCEFEFFDEDDIDCEGESNLVFGYCVVDTQNKEHHYVAIERYGL